MTEADLQLIAGLRREISRAMRVGCTGCGYCLPCPRGVDIPGAFRCLNETKIDSLRRARHEYLQATALRRPATSASLCVNCGKCEQHCPQSLPIRQLLKEAAKELETPLYKLAVQAYRILKI
jgi:predicted aldo/keto reductase-like oxidoreductase